MATNSRCVQYLFEAKTAYGMPPTILIAASVKSSEYAIERYSNNVIALPNLLSARQHLHRTSKSGSNSLVVCNVT